MTRISMRARLAPRQKWGPPAPKAMWGLGLRVMSNRCGSSKTASSRLAEMWKNTTLLSASMGWPPSSNAWVVWRRKFITGVT